MGNVVMDVVRLLAKTAGNLAGSDTHDHAHAVLIRGLTTVHVAGRSMPAWAKFDPMMLREILGLSGLEHTVHGLDALGSTTAPTAGGRVRSRRGRRRGGHRGSGPSRHAPPRPKIRP